VKGWERLPRSFYFFPVGPDICPAGATLKQPRRADRARARRNSRKHLAAFDQQRRRLVGFARKGKNAVGLEIGERRNGSAHVHCPEFGRKGTVEKPAHEALAKVGCGPRGTPAPSNGNFA